MRSGGIDLSTDPRKTGVATIEWHAHGSRPEARLTELALGADDDDLVTLVDRADRTGIDCPLGWPTAFVDFVVAHRDGGLDLDVPHSRAPLLQRATDRRVVEHVGVRPLSVSAERIGATAMRCAAVLARLVRAGTALERTGGSGAVVAGLVLLDRCEPVPPDAVQEARTEGWIALPPASPSDDPPLIPSARRRQGSP